MLDGGAGRCSAALLFLWIVGSLALEGILAASPVLAQGGAWARGAAQGVLEREEERDERRVTPSRAAVVATGAWARVRQPASRNRDGLACESGGEGAAACSSDCPAPSSDWCGISCRDGYSACCGCSGGVASCTCIRDRPGVGGDPVCTGALSL